MEIYQASLKQKVYANWIMFWQRFGFYPNHLVMPDYFIGIINEHTTWTVSPELKKAVKDLKNTCKGINKSSKKWAKQNKKIKANLEKTRRVLNEI